jgi:membrane protease YdiL (CAAX protease family)
MYLKYFDKVNPFEYLKLNVFNLKAVKFTFKGSLGYGLVYLVQFGLPHGPINLSWTAVFGVALTVGVFEETVFRGFILQKFAEHMSFWFANILSSILFTLIHFPGWFGIGLNPNISIASILAVTLLGLLMGALLKVTQSLWPAIIVHQVNDIFAAIIWKV